MRTLIGILLSAFMIGPSFAEKVYLYDGSGKTQRQVNDIPVFKEQDPAQSSERYPTNRNRGKVKCLARPVSTAAFIASVGNAVEVKVIGNCRGFVNKSYVHGEK